MIICKGDSDEDRNDDSNGSAENVGICMSTNEVLECQL